MTKKIKHEDHKPVPDKLIVIQTGAWGWQLAYGTMDIHIAIDVLTSALIQLHEQHKEAHAKEEEKNASG